MSDRKLYVRDGSRYRAATDGDLGGMFQAEGVPKAMGRGETAFPMHSEPPADIVDHFRQTYPSAPPRLIRSVWDVQRSIIQYVAGILINSDLAYRRDPVLQRQMRNDPDVMSPLLQRQMAVSLLEWDIVPEDADDERQVEQAGEIRKRIEHNFRRWHAFIRQLQEAVWYGPAAVEVIYARQREGFDAIGWIPVHSDSIAFTHEGKVGLRVGYNYHAREGETVVVAAEGRVKLLSDRERGALVLHTHDPQGPEYNVPEEARYMFAGRGIRDIVWFQWFMKQTALQLWMAYCERYGMGIRVGTYPAGNPEAKAAMETALQNLVGDVSITMPRDPQNPDLYSISILEPNTGTEQVFVGIIDGYLAGRMKEMIVGQTATTEATATGLGSDVGTRHAQTFQRLIKADAMALGDSLTYDLIRPLHAMNYGPTEYQPRIEFAVEDVDSHEFLEGAQKAYEMGVAISERQLRQRLGLDEPTEDEAVIQKPMGMDGLFGGIGGETEGMEAGIEFARARQRSGRYIRALGG